METFRKIRAARGPESLGAHARGEQGGEGQSQRIDVVVREKGRRGVEAGGVPAPAIPPVCPHPSRPRHAPPGPSGSQRPRAASLSASPSTALSLIVSDLDLPAPFADEHHLASSERIPLWAAFRRAPRVESRTVATDE